MIAVAVPSELGWLLSVNGTLSTVHRVRPGRFGSVDRTISVDCEIENERNSSCLRHNPHEIDSGPILSERERKSPVTCTLISVAPSLPSLFAADACFDAWPFVGR